jgi:hypothetical protein
MEEEDFSDARTETGCPTPASVNIDVPSHVTLRVDERVYHTTAETLMGRSDYFKRLFLGSLGDKPSEIHLDTDPRTFDHVLKYIRRGIFPLLFTAAHGHDHTGYAELLEEARFFQCPSLIQWLENKDYLKCVSWTVTSRRFELDAPIHLSNTSLIPDSVFPLETEERRIYLCPRGIVLHRDGPAKCGRACSKVLGDDEPEYASVNVTTEYLVMQKSWRVNEEWLRDTS